MTKRKHRRREKNDRQSETRPAFASTRRVDGEASGGTFYIYGVHPVRAALLNERRTCLGLYATRDALAALSKSHDEALLRARVPEILETDRRDIDRRVGEDAVHQGLALRVRPLPRIALEDIVHPGDESGRPLLAFDQVTDPRNVGAILRTACLFGAAGAILTDRNAPEEGGALAKAAAGALDIVPIVRVANLARALEEAKQAGYWIFGLDGSGQARLADDLPGPRRLLVLGAEGAGLRRLTRERCDMLVRIPMAGADSDQPAAAVLESLNVSTAAAIALYELTRGDGE